MSEATLFRARADAERANAESAVLGNVRERAERAANAWSAMAERAEQTLAARERREAARTTD
ncbi:hypothetical protein [Sphingomonas sp. 1P08PE]|jgi:hypothetical protein|uniref:hypothetical protein n=1 Tax=Sphingomonas sp. 1P08PE TaxID=554122 RepID=UPI0039A2D4DD